MRLLDRTSIVNDNKSLGGCGPNKLIKWQLESEYLATLFPREIELSAIDVSGLAKQDARTIRMAAIDAIQAL